MKDCSGDFPFLSYLVLCEVADRLLHKTEESWMNEKEGVSVSSTRIHYLTQSTSDPDDTVRLMDWILHWIRGALLVSILSVGWLNDLWSFLSISNFLFYIWSLLRLSPKPPICPHHRILLMEFWHFEKKRRCHRLRSIWS